jgi:hypothetical protein
MFKTLRTIRTYLTELEIVQERLQDRGSPILCALPILYRQARGSYEGTSQLGMGLRSVFEQYAASKLPEVKEYFLGEQPTDANMKRVLDDFFATIRPDHQNEGK